MSDMLEEFVCGCGKEQCDCKEEQEDGLTKSEKIILVTKELTRSAESIGQNLPDAVPRINMEQSRGGEIVTLSVTIN